MWLLTTTAGTPPHDKPEWLSALHSKQRTDNPAPGSLAPFGNSKQDPEPATRAGMHPPTRALETLQEGLDRGPAANNNSIIHLTLTALHNTWMVDTLWSPMQTGKPKQHCSPYELILSCKTLPQENTGIRKPQS
jgi:hypothetical protein